MTNYLNDIKKNGLTLISLLLIIILLVLIVRCYYSNRANQTEGFEDLLADSSILSLDNRNLAKKGIRGVDGLSAFEVWKELSGNKEKSIEDYLNFIKGSDGVKGEQGIPGKDIYLPHGTIAMWYGTNVPMGWKLCKGEDKYIDNAGREIPIPDLRGRFLVGSSNPPSISYDGTTKGGASGVTLNEEKIPRHKHKYTLPTTTATTTATTKAGTANEDEFTNRYMEGFDNLETDAWGGREDWPGGKAAEVNILPPYQAINFIIYVGNTNDNK